MASEGTRVGRFLFLSLSTWMWLAGVFTMLGRTALHVMGLSVVAMSLVGVYHLIVVFAFSQEQLLMDSVQVAFSLPVWTMVFLVQTMRPVMEVVVPVILMMMIARGFPRVHRIATTILSVRRGRVCFRVGCCLMAFSQILCFLEFRIFSLPFSMLSAIYIYVGIVREAYEINGEAGAAIGFIVAIFASLFGYVGIWFSVLYMRHFARYGIVEIKPDKVKVSTQVSRRYSQLSRVMGFDFSKVAELISEESLSALGSVMTDPRILAEIPTIRSYALIGDRVLAYLLSLHARGAGWSVEQASIVQQRTLTNASFAVYFDKYLTDVFPELRERTEKQKGTLCEALVGLALIGGNDQEKINQFLLNYLLK